jgi:predicted ATPase with chaperone activity
MIGPPGAGQSVLAQSLTTILLDIPFPEALKTTAIYRIAGLTGERTALVTTRPCRAPHQTISAAGLIGGGHVPLPGEVSLAHNGVRFLDAWPEFRRHVLAVWRQPLEDGVTRIQFPVCPRSQYACGFSRAGGYGEGFGYGLLTGHHHGGGNDPALVPSGCSWSRAALPLA